jgi:carboxylesterase type B
MASSSTKIRTETVSLEHTTLHTTFTGLVHPLSVPDAPVAQFRGVRYASIPARFRQSVLVSSYPEKVDATAHG